MNPTRQVFFFFSPWCQYLLKSLLIKIKRSSRCIKVCRRERERERNAVWQKGCTYAVNGPECGGDGNARASGMKSFLFQPGPRLQIGLACSEFQRSLGKAGIFQCFLSNTLFDQVAGIGIRKGILNFQAAPLFNWWLAFSSHKFPILRIVPSLPDRTTSNVYIYIYMALGSWYLVIIYILNKLPNTSSVDLLSSVTRNESIRTAKDSYLPPLNVKTVRQIFLAAPANCLPLSML